MQKRKSKEPNSFHVWAPDIEEWPETWMRGEEDLDYGRKLLPYFKEFLLYLYEEGLARKTFGQYRDNLWLLGGTIISSVSFSEEYQEDPLCTLIASVEGDSILPDHYGQMSEAELRAFERMCRRFEKYLQR